MNELEQKIKALGKAAFALYEEYNYIAVDEDGVVWLSDKGFEIIPKAGIWGIKEGPCILFTKLKQHIPNWQELCFSREECENVANVEDVRENRATVKENLTVQFTADEIDTKKENVDCANAFTADELDLICNVFEVKIATYGETPKVKSVFDKCNAILKGGAK